MKLPEINRCPGTLDSGYDSYSPVCLRHMFSGRSVGHILDFSSSEILTGNDSDSGVGRISISGVQEKVALVLDKNKLRFANVDEQAQYILKPVPSFGKFTEEIPANEHLTMQMASQVFGIETANNALIFMADGSPAYITKRFDITRGDKKLAVEDFASLMQKSPQTDGSQYKYSGCYLDIFNTMRKYLPAYQVEAPKLFKLLVFNYLFCNGDAHLKNFSIIETSRGDFKLAPAYDLLNTRLHVEDSEFALEDGLHPKQQSGGQIYQQFKRLGNAAEINDKIYEDILEEMLAGHEAVDKLIDNSFLSKRKQRAYAQLFQRRRNRLKKGID
ncbi:MAG: HipA domain-containing protein [Bacteroidota bacterium]